MSPEEHCKLLALQNHMAQVFISDCHLRPIPKRSKLMAPASDSVKVVC